MRKPWPSPETRLLFGTLTLLKATSAWPWGASSNPKTVRSRTITTPGASIGTRTMLCCLWVGADVSVLPIKMATLQRGSLAPDVHHLRPLRMRVSPSATMEDRMLVASEEATAGSVIAKHDRISPSSNGCSHCCFCLGEPKRRSTSMLPVSGAEQLNTSDAWGQVPITSAITAYSTLVNPAPIVGLPSLSGAAKSAGTHKFHNPSALAFFLSSSRRGLTPHRSGPKPKACSFFELGKMWRDMNDWSFSIRARARGETEYAMRS
mmetsp:Transcript_56812/g.133784  ORF Transcript_56812/g.133784 Transcript_56812/m.133784 type:complete len:263 (+) Transcript_56812:292-1080(+)